MQARSSSLNQYAQFSQMTQSRVASVRQLATGRFDWHATLAQISQVVPKNTSLATLTGTAATSAATTAGAAAPTSTGAPTGTSIALTGCTKSQPDVAKLMSRLRLIDGVDSVTLNSSTKQESAGAPVAAAGRRRPAAPVRAAATAPRPSISRSRSRASRPLRPRAAATSTSTVYVYVYLDVYLELELDQRGT